MKNKVTAIVAGIFLFIGMFVFPLSTFAASSDGIHVTSNYLSDYYLEHNESTTLHAQIGNYSGYEKDLMVKVALKKHDGTVIDTMEWDNIHVGLWQQTPMFSLTSPNDLEPDNYHFSLHVHDANTDELIRHYDNLQMFTVAKDYSGPHLDLHYPNDGMTLSGDVEFKGMAHDPETGVMYVQITHRNSGHIYTVTYNNSTHEFMQMMDTDSWADGYHGFDVMAFNNDGTSTYEYVGFFLNNMD